jgi:hypothetical protein
LTSQPASLAVSSGGVGGFTSGAFGTGDLSFQWFFNDQPVAGATNASLALIDIRISQAGAYYLRVTNLLGSVTSTLALLTVEGDSGLTLRTIEIPTVRSAHLIVRFTTRDGQTAAQITGIRIEGSSDLRSWTEVPAVINVVDGRYQVSLNDPSVLPHRFYRVLYP